MLICRSCVMCNSPGDFYCCVCKQISRSLHLSLARHSIGLVEPFDRSGHMRESEVVPSLHVRADIGSGLLS